jgi:hypothetical protein
MVKEASRKGGKVSFVTTSANTVFRNVAHLTVADAHVAVLVTRENTDQSTQ